MTCTAAGTRPELVIFDLDGTLTDSAPGVVASFVHALRSVGVEPPQREFADLAGLVVGPPMHRTLAGLGLGARTAEAMAAYRADYTRRGWAMNDLYDGIADLLADLRGSGVRLAVATSKLEQTARRILEHFGVADCFEVIAGASPDGARSGKADVLAHALAQLQPLPDRVLMIGDRCHDVEGAAAHGLPVMVVRWGYGAGDFTPGEQVSSVATVAELREALGV